MAAPKDSYSAAALGGSTLPEPPADAPKAKGRKAFVDFAAENKAKAAAQASLSQSARGGASKKEAGEPYPAGYCWFEFSALGMTCPCYSLVG